MPRRVAMGVDMDHADRPLAPTAFRIGAADGMVAADGERRDAGRDDRAEMRSMSSWQLSSEKRLRNGTSPISAATTSAAGVMRSTCS